MLPPFFCLVVNWFPGHVFSCALRFWRLFSPPSLTSIQHTARDGRICKSGERHNMYFYRTFMHEQVSWVIMKKGSLKAAVIRIFQKSFVMSPNPASLQNQRDESFCHRARRRENHSAPNEGRLVGLPSDFTTKRPVSPIGEAGRLEATWQKMGIGGCGVAVPPMGEGSVDCALHYSTLWGKGVGRGRTDGRPAGGGAWPPPSHSSWCRPVQQQEDNDTWIGVVGRHHPSYSVTTISVVMSTSLPGATVW